MGKDVAVEELSEQVGKGAGTDGFHEDREMGAEVVDIERIEKVYR